MWSRVIAGVVLSGVGVFACSLGFDADRYRGGVGGSGGDGMYVGGAEPCFEPRDCELPSPCWVATCDLQRCVLTPLPPMINLQPDEQVVGDCQVLSCDGEGGIVAAPAPDPEFDTLECTVDACDSGMTSHQPKPEGTACGNTSVTKCDAFGICRGCVQASDCGVDDECTSYECDSDGACSTHYVAPTVRLSNQDVGDCKQRICDGHGEVAIIVNQSDPPIDPDPADCSVPYCDGPTPSFQPPPDGSKCGSSNGQVCCKSSCCAAPNGCGANPVCVDTP